VTYDGINNEVVEMVNFDEETRKKKKKNSPKLGAKVFHEMIS
jgi:hypothetical protein